MIEHTPNKFNAYLTKEIKENPNLPKELEEIGEQIDDRVRVHDEAVEAYKKRLVDKLEVGEPIHPAAKEARDRAIKLIEKTF